MNRSLLSISALLISCLILVACGEKKPPAPDPASIPVQVNLYEAHSELPVYYDRYPGTITATQQVDLHAVVQGYVTGIFFKDGGQVKKGQKLYTIDDSKYKASYSQAEVSIRVAESNVDQAQKDADRYIYLNEHEAVAKQLLDHAMTTLQNAKNLLAATKQDLVKAQTDLDFSVIRSPFDGTIGISQVKLGNTVIAGQTILNTVSSDGPVYADFIVNEKQIPGFAKLLLEKTAQKDSIFSLVLPDNMPYEYQGQIAMIDRSVNPQTGSIVVRLSFPNPSFVLRSGMSCTIRVRNSDTTQQILIPSRAITEQMGEYFVYVAKDTLIAPADTTKQKDGVAKGPSLHAIQKKVLLGQTIADRVIVRSGVLNGDKIVADGVQKLHDGSLIAAGSQEKNTGH